MNFHRLQLTALLISLVFLPAAVPAEVTLDSLLTEMVDFSAVARWPQPSYTCRQFSSYDRATVAPDKPGWFANEDHTQYLRDDETDGRKEHVMMDTDGPGSLVRFWLTSTPPLPDTAQAAAQAKGRARRRSRGARGRGRRSGARASLAFLRVERFLSGFHPLFDQVI